MLLKWQSTLNSNSVVGAVLMDLSKAFDCLPHDLLIAKLATCGFGKKITQTSAQLSERQKTLGSVGFYGK